MNTFFKKIILMICVCMSVSWAQELKKPPKPYVIEGSDVYNDIAITSVANSAAERKKKNVSGYDLVIQSITFKPNQSLSGMERWAEPLVPALGKEIWRISMPQIPLTENDCDAAEVDTCDGIKNCYKSCLVSSPKLIDFNEKSGKLYLAMRSSDAGTGGGTYFTFVADINKKQIKYLHPEAGPLVGWLSPSGKYLILASAGSLIGYDTDIDKRFEVMEKQWIFDPIQKRKFYNFGSVKWISDTQFTYHEFTYHDKFQDDVDGITEYLFDIASKTNVLKKVIKADTYVYQPGKEA